MSVKTRFTKKRSSPSRKLKIPSNQGITIQLNDSGCDDSQKRIATAKTVNRIVNEENSTKCSAPRVRLQRVGTNCSAAQYKIAKVTLVNEQNQNPTLAERPKYLPCTTTSHV